MVQLLTKLSGFYHFPSALSLTGQPVAVGPDKRLSELRNSFLRLLRSEHYKLGFPVCHTKNLVHDKHRETER